MITVRTNWNRFLLFLWIYTHAVNLQIRKDLVVKCSLLELRSSSSFQRPIPYLAVWACSGANQRTATERHPNGQVGIRRNGPWRAHECQETNGWELFRYFNIWAPFIALCCGNGGFHRWTPKWLFSKDKKGQGQKRTRTKKSLRYCLLDIEGNKDSRQYPV